MRLEGDSMVVCLIEFDELNGDFLCFTIGTLTGIFDGISFEHDNECWRLLLAMDSMGLTSQRESSNS